MDWFETELRRASIMRVVGFAIAIFFAVMATRIPTFWTVSTHIDEGVFALVAREIVNGNLPYSTVFEHKPIALYYPAALFMALFGTTPEVMHFTSAVLVLMTCMALFHYALKRGLSDVHSFLLAVSYAVLTCGFQGYASLSEINVNAFMAIGFALADTGFKSSLLRRFLAGLSFGAALHSNYIVGFALVGVGLGYTVTCLHVRSTFRAYVMSSAALLLGFFSATFLILLPLMLWGDLTQYLQDQIAFLSGYSVGRDPLGLLERLLLFAPTIAIIIGILLVNNSTERDCDSPPYLIFGATLGFVVAIYLGGRNFDHYFLFFLPGISFTLAWALSKTTMIPAVSILAIAAFFGQSVTIYGGAFYTFQAGTVDLIRTIAGQEARYDVESRIVQAASAHVAPGDLGYVSCANPMLYVALGLEPATRYAFYPHHLYSLHTDAFETTPENEINAIIERRPSLVILGDYASCVWISRDTWDTMQTSLEDAGYVIMHAIEGYMLMRPREQISTVSTEHTNEFSKR